MRARLTVVHGDQVVAAEEEVGVVRGEPVLRGPEVDAVQDQIHIAVVRLDLRMRHFGHRIFNGQRVKVKGIGKDSELVRRGCGQVHPQVTPLPAVEPLRLDCRHAFGDVVAVEEDGNHRLQAPGSSPRRCRLQSGAGTARSLEPGARSR